MAMNIAARRGAKNQRRKAIVAEKRKAELDNAGVTTRIRLAQADPIQYCLLSEGLFDDGIGMLTVARGATPYRLTSAMFLLDTFGLGVKDAFISSLAGRALDSWRSMTVESGMVPVDPGYARKLLRDLVAWSRTLGVAPARDYPKIEPIFGTVDAAACDAGFQFGHNGKPMFIGDLSEMPRRLAG
jgi:hypothetical protein